MGAVTGEEKGTEPMLIMELMDHGCAQTSADLCIYSFPHSFHSKIGWLSLFREETFKKKPHQTTCLKQCNSVALFFFFTIFPDLE
jgi:hypothetical protein